MHTKIQLDMLKFFKTLSLSFLALTSFFSYAQVSEGGRPYTFVNASTRSQADSLFGSYQIVDLVKPNLAVAVAEDLINDQEGLSYRVGLITPLSLSITNSGTWTVLPDGSKIWRLGVRMADAQALSLYFSTDVIIRGAGKLNAYNESQTQYIGSYSSTTPAFQAMEMIEGELITLEYFMPSGETLLPAISISGISYYYRGIEDRIAGFRESTLSQNRGPHLSCQVDVACSEISGWTNQRDAVVHYSFVTNAGTSLCSAGIINNTANDCTPYVLSANHCGEPTSNSHMNGHVWYFNYQRPTCSPGNTSRYNGARSQTMSGASLKASSQLGTAPASSTNQIKGSDFYLAELNSAIPSSYNAYYAGWNKTSNAPSSGVGIHHPKGDEKKIATYSSTPAKVSYGGAWPYSHLKVFWGSTANGSGALEGGSSGSPLFNQNGLIVGPATASSLTCGSAGGYSLYGRLFKAWTQEGSNANQRLQPWLDPLNTGVNTLAGTYAPCSSGGGGSTTGTCSTPIAISCGSPYNGTTVDGQNNISAYTSCAPQPENGKEKIHAITITQQSNLTATLSNLNGVDLDVHILSSCNPGGCLARDDISASATNLAAGTYLIAVDGYGTTSSQSGTYTLTVTCTPTGGGGGNPTGDCSNPIAISCGSPYNGTTVDGQNNISAYTSCAPQPENGKEKIHAITITQQSNLTATLSNLNGVDLDVHILSSCNPGGCLARDDISASATNLAAGTYLIAVDGYGTTSSQSGTYTLTVTCTPTGGGGGSPTGDCSNPIAISCGSPYNGTTVDGQNNISAYSSCAPQPENGKEKIHAITITQQSNLTATLSNLNGVDLDVHILSSCNPGGCLARDDISASATNLAAGTYLIAVDGYGTTSSQSGIYTLTVTCTPTGGGGGNPTGDCSNPIAISCGSPYNGTTVDGQNNISAYTSCAPQPENGKEKIHAITITQQSNLTATLSNLNGVDLDVHILSSCNPGGCLARDDISASATNLAAGTYLIAVDGYGTTSSQSGTYTLTVTCTPTGGGGGCAPETNSISQSICQGDVYQFGSQQLTSSGSYTNTYTNNAGCDSVVTLNLNVIPNSSSNITQSICQGEVYIFGSQVLSQMGSYTEVYSNVNGCDSTVNLTLTVMQTSNSSVSETTCQSPYSFGSQSISQSGTYTETFQSIAGCDSVVTLTLVILSPTNSSISQTICSGDSVQLGNQYYVSNGTYSEVFIGSNGCDSLVVLSLTVQAQPLITINMINGDLVSSIGSAYQWYLDGNLIVNETGQNHTPTQNGVYSVETTSFNGCVGEGAYNLQNVNIVEMVNAESVLIYPNPNAGIFRIDSKEAIEFTVSNVLGEIIYQSTSKSKNHQLNLDLSKGIYYVNIIGSNNNFEILVE